MTVIRPNSVAGINSITVQSGNSLAVHKANGELIRTITSNTGVSTFSSVSVGTATTDNSAAKSINIGLGASISQHTDNSLSFGTGGDERARIDSSGRLMVGHNSSLAIGGGDNAPLQTSATSSVVFGGVRYANASGGPFLSLSKSRATTAGSNTIVQDGDELGTILFSGDDGTDLISKGAQIQAQVDGAPGSNDMPGRLLFYTTADGAASPTERLRITSAGDVGIGYNSPTVKLHVREAASGASSYDNRHHIIIEDDAEAYLGLYLPDNGYGGIRFYDTTGQEGLIDYYFDTDDMHFHSTGTHIFKTAGSERLRIDSNGRLGIQGEATKALLDVRASGGSATMLTAVFGANEGQSGGTLSDNTDKACRIGSYHYDTDEEPFGILVASGTNGTNNLTFGGGTSLMNAATEIKFNTAANSTTTSGTTRMTIDASGRILQGSTATRTLALTAAAPQLQLEGVGSNASTSAIICNSNGTAAGVLDFGKTRGTAVGGTTIVQDGDDLGHIAFEGSDGSAQRVAARINARVDGSPGSSDMPGLLRFLTTPAGSATEEERMRISSTGQVLVGNASDNAAPFTTSTIFNVERTNGNVASFYHHGTGNNPVIIVRHQRSGSSGNSGVNFQFNNTNGSAVGYILSNASSTSFQTSSDYRLKENAVSISDGITRLKTLKPYRFNFKDDPTATIDGFFAHEVTAVPEAISGSKDEVVTQAMLDNGDAPSESKLNDPIYQGIDQSKLVPLLTAALQEAVTKIETLETKVAALEGG